MHNQFHWESEFCNATITHRSHPRWLSEFISGPLQGLIEGLLSPGEPSQPLSACLGCALAALHALAPLQSHSQSVRKALCSSHPDLLPLLGARHPSAVFLPSCGPDRITPRGAPRVRETALTLVCPGASSRLPGSNISPPPSV